MKSLLRVLLGLGMSFAALAASLPYDAAAAAHAELQRGLLPDLAERLN